MAKNVTVVQTGHGELRDDHLQERRESREDTELVRIESETGRRGEVTTLHDTRRDEDLGVSLMDDLQTGRTLKIA